MGATAVDVARELQWRLEKLNLVAAFLTYHAAVNRIAVTTLLNDLDEATEAQLAADELNVEKQFSDFAFDFSTIHLKGRDLNQFIPDDAFTLVRPQAPPRAHVG